MSGRDARWNTNDKVRYHLTLRSRESCSIWSRAETRTAEVSSETYSSFAVEVNGRRYVWAAPLSEFSARLNARRSLELSPPYCRGRLRDAEAWLEWARVLCCCSVTRFVKFSPQVLQLNERESRCVWTGRKISHYSFAKREPMVMNNWNSWG